MSSKLLSCSTLAWCFFAIANLSSGAEGSKIEVGRISAIDQRAKTVTIETVDHIFVSYKLVPESKIEKDAKVIESSLLREKMSVTVTYQRSTLEIVKVSILSALPKTYEKMGTDASASLIGDRSEGQAAKTADQGVVIKDAQKASFFMASGISATGKLLSLNSTNVSCLVQGKKYNYASKLFKSVELDGEVLVYSPAQKAFVRLQPVTVKNNSGERLTFTLIAADSSHGNEVIYTDDRPKTNLETGLAMFAEALGGAKNSPQAPVEWVLDHKEQLDLRRGNSLIRSNRVRFTLTTSHGVTKQIRENGQLGSNFILTIEKADVHSPVLVKLGSWKVEQDVSYTTVRGREPARATTVPIESFDKKRIVRYETYYYEGRDYEYTQRVNGGIATASAEIENPTNKRLVVSITLEFSFVHLLLSQTQVSSQIEVAPNSKGMVRMEVNTKGFFNKRSVTGVKVIDVTTTPK